MHDHDVPGYLAELGLPGIVDAHVHFMEPSILAKVWAYFDAVGPKVGRPWPITYRGTDDERVAALRELGVKKFSALSYAHRPGVAGFMNDWTRDFARRTPDALWSATFYPEPDAGQYVTDLVEGGVEIFKAHLQVGEFSPLDPLLDPVWSVLEEAGTPIVLHAGSGPAPGEFTGPELVESLLERHPRLPLVIAHLGMPEIAEFLALGERFANVRLDTTMAFVDFFGGEVPPGVPGQLEALQDRILFGTDFPNIPYQYAHQIEVLRRLDLGDDWMRAVLWHNGARLFGVAA